MVHPILIHRDDFPELLRQWEARAHEELPDVHPNRQREWALGRVALARAFKSQGIDLELGRCHWVGHQELMERPDLRFSLSHTRDWAGAVVVDARCGPGLDVELLGRAVPEQVQSRLQHAQDLSTLAPLELWCAKEAIYKCLPADAQEKIWLNSIRVGRGEFTVDGFALSGSWERVEHSQLMVVQALRP